jgi:hypothetical protein
MIWSGKHAGPETGAPATTGFRTTMGGNHAQSRQSTASETARRRGDDGMARIKKFKAAGC